MIDPKSLRIGNLIFDEFGTARTVNYLGETIGLDFEGGGTLKYQHNPIISGDINLLQGIVLTEEWLVRLGFMYDSGWYDFGKISVWKKMDRLVQKLNTKIPTYNQFVCPKYVHQLQNLYFCLTGEELTVKTPQP